MGTMVLNIGTVSGRSIDYNDPQPEDLDIRDIAVALSHNCRFAGQIERFYSVAQHSIMVARKVLEATNDPRKALQGLLHDGSEAYTNDIPTPYKRQIGEFARDTEDRLQHAIYAKHGLPLDMLPEVHEADQRALITERDQLQPRHAPWASYQGVQPYDDVIVPKTEEEVQSEFLLLYDLLLFLIQSESNDG